MNDFIKMDVFFFVTTVVVLCAGILLLVAMFYLIRILKSFDEVMKNVSEESYSIRNDFQMLRAQIRAEGMKVKYLSDFFSSIAARKKARTKRTPHVDE